MSNTKTPQPPPENPPSASGTAPGRRFVERRPSTGGIIFPLPPSAERPANTSSAIRRRMGGEGNIISAQQGGRIKYNKIRKHKKSRKTKRRRKISKRSKRSKHSKRH